ncbi:MAG: T9SS type A sorting domain-containing protein [candidate division WOR-3 bacterium]|nr:T9SS type A sorting domain-containing protein [candidate division WOR-3 bacterium]
MYRTRLVSALAMAALAAILLPSTLTAQITFQRTYGGTDNDFGYSVQQTTDGGYIVAGLTYSYGAGFADVFLVRTDANGNTLWTKTYGGTMGDEAYAIERTSDGGFIVVGCSSFYDGYVLKTDPNGDTLWSRSFSNSNDDAGRAVQQTSDGGYIIAGHTLSSHSEYDVYLMKTDAQGDTLWTRTYGGRTYDWGSSVEQTADGGYIIAGYTLSFGAGDYDVYIIKTDANGDTLWTRAYGGPYDDRGHSIQQTIDSGYIIAGCTRSLSSGFDVYVVKVNASGDTLWTRCYGGPLNDWGNSVQQTADGGYIVAGYTESFGAGHNDVYLIKTDANGGTLWTRTFGGTRGEEGWSAQQTADGGYIVTGLTYSFGAGGSDVYLIKTDSLGNVAVAEPKTNPTRAPALSLSCEPNPCRGATRISLTPQASSSRPLTLRIYDSQGCLVHSVFGIRTSSFPLDLRALPSGAYFVRLDAGSQHATARIVLQR